MRIIANSNRSYINCNNPSFQHGGKPITLDYVVQKHSKIVPQRVLEYARKIISSATDKNYPSLMDIHKKLYEPLMSCRSLNEVKKLYPEFESIKNEVKFSRDSRYSREFYEHAGNNFVLKMLQDVWVNLRTQDEIAKSMGLTSGTSLAWPLKQIGFVSYSSNYKTLLKSSDIEGNKIIANKTTAWNKAHPDLMYKKNKHAAQFCKTEEYRKKVSETMKAYYIEHPENIKRKSKLSKEMWAKVPEIKKAMSDFIKNEPIEIRRLFAKKIKKYPLKSDEFLTIKSVYERFWEQYPEFKEKLSIALKEALKSIDN